MAKPAQKDIVKALMARHDRTYCKELGIPLEKNTPSPLFQWLVASLLFSARIGAGQAVKGAKALFGAGWRTPEKMHAATWRERVTVLNEHGYARYDESTSRMLEDASGLLIERYGGDLRRLREEARGDVKKAQKLLTAFKGIGPTGAAIFLREAQGAWDEFHPFADKKALKAGKQLGLGSDAQALSRHVSRNEFPALLTALVRADLAGDLGDLAKGEAEG